MPTALFFKEIRTRNMSSFFTGPSLTTWKKAFQMALESNGLKNTQHKQTMYENTRHTWHHDATNSLDGLPVNKLSPLSLLCLDLLTYKKNKTFCSYCWLARWIKTSTRSNSCKFNLAVCFVVVLLLSNGRHQPNWLKLGH